MDPDQSPSWSKGDLRRLGEALVIDKAATPAGCPQYGEVMLWHNDLAAEVAARIANVLWVAMPQDLLSISARAKTVDTMVQKLQRTTLNLGQVQDLAGVRVDADMALTQQTDLAQEIAEYFGAARTSIKDIRAKPHSGYRAVHVWLVLPAGRVEVQIRTLYQSDWANAYEALGEFYGRGVRYGEYIDAHVQELVDAMHKTSAAFAKAEEFFDKWWQFDHLPRRLRRRLGQVGAVPKRDAQLHADLREQLRKASEGAREMYRMTKENPGLKYSMMKLDPDKGA